MKEHAEQVLGSKSGSSTPPWLLLPFLPLGSCLAPVPKLISLSLSDGQLPGRVRWEEPFPFSWSWCLITAVETWLRQTASLKTPPWKNSAGTDPEVSPLLDNFHNVGKSYACQRRRETTTTLIQLWTLGATIMTGLARYAYWCNSGMDIIWVTNHFPIGPKVYFTA